MKNWISGEEVQHTYRFAEAVDGGGDGGGQSNGYDRCGNLLSKSVTKGSAPAMSVFDQFGE